MQLKPWRVVDKTDFLKLFINKKGVGERQIGFGIDFTKTVGRALSGRSTF
jgi:hypothetical protein